MTEEKLSPQGSFALMRIHRFLEEASAGSYQGQSPAFSNPAYAFFEKRYQECNEDRLAGVEGKLIGQRAVGAIREYLDNKELSGEEVRLKSASAARAYQLFSDGIKTIERLEAGENIRDILNEIREGEMDQDHGFPEIQSP